MRIRPFLLLIALFYLFSPQLILAQSADNTKKDPPVVAKNNQSSESLFKFGFNESVLVSDFSPMAQKRQVPTANIGVSIERPKSYLNAKAQYPIVGFPTFAVSVNAGHEMTAVKRFQTTIGVSYFYSRQNENILNQSSPPFKVDGSTGKQKFLLDVAEGFSLKATRVRLSFLVGGVQFAQKVSVSTGGHQISTGDNSIYENIVFFPETRIASGIGLSLTLRPIKHLTISIVGEGLSLLANPTHLMPTRQYQAGSEITYFMFRKLGVSIHGSLSNAEQRAVVFPKGLGTDIVIKF